MRDTTRQMIKLAIEGDPEATAAELEGIKAVLKGKANPAAALATPEPFDRVLTRKEVAALFHKCIKWVDIEANRPGTLLERVYLAGARCAGFSEMSVRKALANRREGSGVRS